MKGDELVLKQSASYCFRQTDEFSRQMKEEYFRIMAHIANDEQTSFRNAVDRHILIRHAEGAKIKTIVAELIRLKMPRDRYSVRIIIRRYEMLWGIKSYCPRQLHMKTSYND